MRSSVVDQPKEYIVERYRDGTARIEGKVSVGYRTVGVPLPTFADAPKIEFVRGQDIFGSSDSKWLEVQVSTVKFEVASRSSEANGEWTWIARGRLLDQAS